MSLNLLYLDPGNSVTNLYAVVYNSTTIRITWMPPSKPYGHIKYRLYQQNTSFPVNIVNIESALVYDGGSTTFDSSNLEENHVYYFLVIPYNIKYKLDGPKSFTNGTTHEDGKS